MTHKQRAATLWVYPGLQQENNHSTDVTEVTEVTEVSVLVLETKQVCVFKAVCVRNQTVRLKDSDQSLFHILMSVAAFPPVSHCTSCFILKGRLLLNVMLLCQLLPVSRDSAPQTSSFGAAAAVTLASEG